MYLLFMCVLCRPGLGGPEASCRVDRSSVLVGEAVRLVVRVRGPEAADCMVSPWKLRGDLVVLERRGPLFSMVPQGPEGGAVLEARFEKKVVPLDAGSLALPPVELLLPGGKGLSLSAPILEVRPRKALDPREEAALRLEGPGRRVFLNERFFLTVTLELPRNRFETIRRAPRRERFLVPSWNRSTLPWRLAPVPPASGEPALCVPFPGGDEVMEFERLDAGVEKVRLAGRLAGRAARIGRFVVPSCCFRAASVEGGVLFTRSASLPVEVAPLPAAGRPESATNGVGPLRVRFRLEKRVFEEGKPVSFFFEVEGEGDLSYLAMPAFRKLASAFDVAAVRDGGGEGRRFRCFQLLPRRGAAPSFPALAFSWFDPTAGRYETVRFGPVPVKMTGAEGRGKGAPSSTPKGGEKEGGWPWILGGALLLTAAVILTRRIRTGR